MINVTRFSKATGSVEFEVEEGSPCVFRREYETRDGKRRSVCGVLTLGEAREEQVRLIGAGYRVAAAG